MISHPNMDYLDKIVKLSTTKTLAIPKKPEGLRGLRKTTFDEKNRFTPLLSLNGQPVRENTILKPWIDPKIEGVLFFTHLNVLLDLPPGILQPEDLVVKRTSQKNPALRCALPADIKRQMFGNNRDVWIGGFDQVGKLGLSLEAIANAPVHSDIQAQLEKTESPVDSPVENNAIPPLNEELKAVIEPIYNMIQAASSPIKIVIQVGPIQIGLTNRPE